MSSHSSNGSSIHQWVMQWSAQSQDGIYNNVMPDSMVPPWWHRKAWDQSQCPSAGWIGRCHRKQSHSRLWARHRIWTRGVRPWDQASQSCKRGHEHQCWVCKVEIPHEDIFQQHVTHPSVRAWIQCVHQEQGPEVMTSWLKDMYYCLDLVWKQPDCLLENKA